MVLTRPLKLEPFQCDKLVARMQNSIKTDDNFTNIICRIIQMFIMINMKSAQSVLLHFGDVWFEFLPQNYSPDIFMVSLISFR
jgi:hypothetical protein